MKERYSENSDTCSLENSWGVTTGGEPLKLCTALLSLTSGIRTLARGILQTPRGLGDPWCRVSEANLVARAYLTLALSITLSPVSVTAKGLISDERGLSLRFPRFIKMRDDKGIQQASTPAFIASMYRNQEGRGKVTKGLDEGDLVDASSVESEVEEEGDMY